MSLYRAMGGWRITVVFLSSALIGACLGPGDSVDRRSASPEATSGDAAAKQAGHEVTEQSGTMREAGPSLSPSAGDDTLPSDRVDASVSPEAEPGGPDVEGTGGRTGGDVAPSADASSDRANTSGGGEDAGASGDVSNDAGSVAVVSCEPNAVRCNGDVPEICDTSQIWRQLLTCEAPARCVSGECRQPIGNACPLVPTLARFESGLHLVDGDGSEFADIEPVTYALRDAPVVNASYAAELPTTVSLRLAWSESAFVAHVHVEDPAVYPYQGTTLEYYWQGDNVQFFIAPTDALTGVYSGTEDGGATHLIIVPPTETQPAQALEVYEPCYACVDASFSSVAYAARLVDGGYEIELSWPWSAPQGTLAPGDRVALNVVVGAGDSPGGGLELEGLLANNPVDGDTPCGGAAHPGCDNRTWCYSVLE